MNFLSISKVAVISLFFWADILLTYLFMVKYTKKYPKDKNWKQMELNFILRKCWKIWGLHKGTLISAIIIYPILFSFAYFIQDKFILGIIMGLYIMVFLSHIINLQSLGKKDEQV